MSRFYTALRVLLGVVFIAASLSKILNPHDFAEIIYNYKMLPGILVAPVAVVLPWFELLCGSCLVLGIMPAGNATILFAMMLTFVGALIFNLTRGLNIACGCFTADPNEEANMLQAAIRDGFLLAMAFYVFLCEVVIKRAKAKKEQAGEQVLAAEEETVSEADQAEQHEAEAQQQS